MPEIYAALTGISKIQARSSTYTFQELLRARNIYLQAPSVIRQATITELADSNNPRDIAAILANASGLARCVDPMELKLAHLLDCSFVMSAQCLLSRPLMLLTDFRLHTQKNIPLQPRKVYAAAT